MDRHSKSIIASLLLGLTTSAAAYASIEGHEPFCAGCARSSIGAHCPFCRGGAAGQGQTHNHGQDSMPDMKIPMDMGHMNAAGMFLVNNMSGTAVNPAAWPMPMLRKQLGSWNAMFMSEAFLDDTQQSGPRGGDKLYSPNWLMALGPIAYPHRASAMELPQATLAHHVQDSTHISDEVITAGIAYKKMKIEASGFYGSEPGENRWIIQGGPINSWSARLWYFPGKNWAAQFSLGHLTHPEALDPGDQFRTTASIEYSKPLGNVAWSSSLIWGRVHNTYTYRDLNSYTPESVLPIGRRNFLTGRAELVDKDELFGRNPYLEQMLDAFYGSTFRIGAYTLGYTHDFDLFANIETGLGANIERRSPAWRKCIYQVPPQGKVLIEPGRSL